jgi:transposase
MAAIEKLTGLKRSEKQVMKFLKKIGLRHRKVGTIPSKANVEEQESFKKNAGTLAQRSQRWEKNRVLR